jgi:uncharacterized protein (DUF1015 family)
MARIIPFRAIRAPRHLAHLVVTRPYYTYPKNVMEAKLKSNRYSLLHIINPEFGLNERNTSNPAERFVKVREKFHEFLRNGYLVQDEVASLYIYRQSVNNKSYCGIICATSVEDYDNDIIKKHESTLTNREELFVKYLEITGFNAEPVLISHKPNQHIRAILDEVTKARPEYEFTTTDAIKHELWILDKNFEPLIIKEFEKMDALYIADGHHRSASSSRLAAKKRAQGCGKNDPSQFCMSFLIEESELSIFPFHRVITDLNGQKFDQFLDGIQEYFDIAETHLQEPQAEHEIILVRERKNYLLRLKSGIVDLSHPVKSLSTQFLTDLILEPLLNIYDQKTSSRIEFVSGFEGVEATLNILKKYPDGVAFLLYPISMAQVRRVGDERLIMPPKSTWVEPKLRSGMTIYSFDNDC